MHQTTYKCPSEVNIACNISSPVLLARTGTSSSARSRLSSSGARFRRGGHRAPFSIGTPLPPRTPVQPARRVSRPRPPASVKCRAIHYTSQRGHSHTGRSTAVWRLLPIGKTAGAQGCNARRCVFVQDAHFCTVEWCAQPSPPPPLITDSADHCQHQYLSAANAEEIPRVSIRRPLSFSPQKGQQDVVRLAQIRDGTNRTRFFTPHPDWGPYYAHGGWCGAVTDP